MYLGHKTMSAEGVCRSVAESRITSTLGKQVLRCLIDEEVGLSHHVGRRRIGFTGMSVGELHAAHRGFVLSSILASGSVAFCGSSSSAAAPWLTTRGDQFDSTFQLPFVRWQLNGRRSNSSERVLADMGGAASFYGAAYVRAKSKPQSVIELNTLDAKLMQHILLRLVGKVSGFNFLEQRIALLESVGERGRDLLKICGVEVVGGDIDVGLYFGEAGLELREGGWCQFSRMPASVTSMPSKKLSSWYSSGG